MPRLAPHDLPADLKPSRQRRAPSRRGITILIMLLLISMTLAVSYAMVRSQMSTVQIQGNSVRRDQAYQAALTGISTALRKMHQSSWSGVGVPISGSLTAYDTYQVTFATGDPALTAASTDYADYPYRVTVVSTGSSVDPTHGTTVTRRIEVVVRLIATRLGTQPSVWPTLQQYTVYQTDTKAFTLHVPCRVEGAVRIQGAVNLTPDYSWNTPVRSRYLSDLTAMYASNVGDYRPMNGPVNLPTSKTSNTMRSLMTNELGLTLTNIAETAATSLPFPSQLQTYRIYPGGKLYQVPQVGSTLQQTLQPDPISNPLGIYFAPSNLVVSGQVTIQGTLVSNDNVHIGGTVHFLPHNLPALKGSTSPVRLPAAVVQKSFVLDAAGKGDLTGLLLAQDFILDTGSAANSFNVLGRVVADQFVISGRSQWNISNGVWVTCLQAFNDQLTAPISVRINFFPLWLSSVGLPPQPLLTVKQDPAAATQHWQDPSQPFYVADPADGGLRWDMVRWTDNQ